MPACTQQCGVCRGSPHERGKRVQVIGFARRFVPADAVDAGKAHGQPAFVPGGRVDRIEGDLEDQRLFYLTGPKRPTVWLRIHLSSSFSSSSVKPK